MNQLNLNTLKEKDNSPGSISVKNKKIKNKPSHLIMPKILDTSISLSTCDLLRQLNGMKKETVPYEDYLTVVKDAMSQYHNCLTSPPLPKDAKDSSDRNILITGEDETEIKKVLDQSQSFISMLYKGNSDESKMKIVVPEHDYRSPYESLRALKKNRKVHDDVNESFLERQKRLFDEEIERIEKYTMKFKVRMPKIKATNLIAKNYLSDMTKKEELATIEEIKMESSPKKKANKEKYVLPAIPVEASNCKLFAYFRYANKNFPEGREQFSLSISTSDIILIGGMGVNIKANNVWSLNPDSLEWKKIYSLNTAPNSRFGHTGILFQNKVFIFGGRTKYSDANIVADFEFFNLEDKNWHAPLVYTKSTLKIRRNHVADLIGQHMIVHGGISDMGEYLNDTALLNLSTPIRWTRCHVNEDTPGPTLFGHTCALVVPSEIRFSQKFHIYKFPELGIGRYFNNRIKEKGWYIFGGKSKEEGGLSNEMYILQIGKKPVEWMKVDTHGVQPCPRYFHSMNFYEQGNFLIIHGGRNDLTSESFALNDTYIFNLFTFDWSEVLLYSNLRDFKVLSRCGHSSIVYSHKLIIFGGMNTNNYVGAALFIVNLDFNYKPGPTEDQISLEILKSNVEEMGPEVRMRIDRLQKAICKNQLALVPDLVLPEIK